MDKPTISGTDVSSYQGNYNPVSSDSFVIAKATEGRTYTNPYHASQVSRARAKGLVVGHYHYLLPGNAAAQARYFVSKANAKKGDLLVCDWERTSTGDPSNADKDTFIKTVKSLMPGFKVGLYCNVYYWTSLDRTSYCGDFLWIAQYSSRAPGIQHPFEIWQYQGTPIDRNVAYFSNLAAMKSWAGAVASKPASPKPSPAPSKPAPPVTSAPEGLFGMTKIAKYNHASGQKIAANTWTTLEIARDDKNRACYSFYPTGPSNVFIGAATVVVEGMPVGKEFKLRFYQLDYNLKTGEGKRFYTYPNVECIGTGGESNGQVIVGPDSMGTAASGWQRRTRVEIWAPSPVTVKSIYVRTAY